MKKCIITGCEGFIGSHLADLLVEKSLQVFAMVYRDTKNIEHLRGKMVFLECDLKDRGRVEEIIDEVKPDIVFHLGAQCIIPISWENPEETLKTNVLGSFYLLEAIRKAAPDATVEVVGSSAIYGPRDESESPMGEETDFRPTSMYAVSKLGQETLGYFYWKAFGMKVIRVRPFNISGPRKLYDACSDFARGIAEVERGLRDVLEVGNLETIRDFSDGRDAVRAMWLMVEKGEFGQLYNLCSGRGWKMKDVLECLIRFSCKKIRHRVVPEKLRPFDDPIYIGDNSKLKGLGWEPKIPMEQTLEDLLSWWRANL
ncbi:GDP-mannose 4,6-dehydratase [Chloroflexota bacterium]